MTGKQWRCAGCGLLFLGRLHQCSNLQPRRRARRRRRRPTGRFWPELVAEELERREGNALVLEVKHGLA